MIIRVSEEGEEETMKFVLAPDSFKGTMSSLQVCAIMKKALREQYPDSEVVQLPIADGGEGSIDCFLEAVGGVKKYVTVSGPFGEPMKGYYGILNGGKKTAIIEMAVCAGLPLVSGRENPETATTYGVGELIKDAVEEGCEKIILGLGGSMPPIEELKTVGIDMSTPEPVESALRYFEETVDQMAAMQA